MADLKKRRKTRDGFTLKNWGRLLLIVAILAVALPVGAEEEWTKIRADNTSLVWYINQRSIEDHDSYVTCWVKFEPSDENVDFSYAVVLYAVAKDSRQITAFQAVVYDRNDSQVFSISPQQMELLFDLSGRGQWEYCVPGSDEEAIWEALMQAAGYR